MKKSIIVLTTLIIPIILITSTTCGGGSNLDNIYTPTLATTNPATTAPTPAGLPEVEPGMLCLYFKATLEVQTSTIEDPGDFTEYRYGIFRYIPSLDQLVQVTEIYTTSSGQAREYPYTTDGRLFRVWKAPGYNDKIFELDISTGKDINQGNSGDFGGLAVIGDSLYYIREGLNKFEDFCVDTLGSLASPRQILCRGCTIYYHSQYAVGSKLIRVNYGDTGGIFNIIRLNPTTGDSEASIKAEVHIDKTKKYIFFEDQKALYIALQAEEDNSIAIYRLPENYQSYDFFELVTTLNETENLVSADADDGRIVLHFAEGDINHFVIYDTRNSSTQDFWLPTTTHMHNVEYMQVLIAK